MRRASGFSARSQQQEAAGQAGGQQTEAKKHRNRQGGIGGQPGNAQQQHRGPLAHAPAGEGKREKGDQHGRRHQGETVGKGERQAEALRQQVGGAHRQKLRQRRKQQQREGGRRRQQQDRKSTRLKSST